MKEYFDMMRALKGEPPHPPTGLGLLDTFSPVVSAGPLVEPLPTGSPAGGEPSADDEESSIENAGADEER